MRLRKAEAKAPNLRFEGPRNSNSPFWRKNFGTKASSFALDSSGYGGQGRKVDKVDKVHKRSFTDRL